MEFNANPRLANIPERWPAIAFSSIGDTAQQQLMWPELLFSYADRPGVKWIHWAPPDFETLCSSVGITLLKWVDKQDVSH